MKRKPLSVSKTLLLLVVMDAVCIMLSGGLALMVRFEFSYALT